MIRSFERVLFGPKKVVEDARGGKIVPELPLVRDSRLIGPHRAEELISEHRLKNDNFFDVATVRNIWNEHVSQKCWAY